MDVVLAAHRDHNKLNKDSIQIQTRNYPATLLLLVHKLVKIRYPRKLSGSSYLAFITTPH